MFKFGWKKSSGDLGVTPFNVSKTVIELGSQNYHDEYIIKNNVPIFNQLSLNSCVANSCVAALSILQEKEFGKYTELSRLFLYWNARAAIGETHKDEGSFIHDALSSLKTTGVCEDSFWPYNTESVFLQPKQIIFKRGDDNQIGEYYQVLGTGFKRLEQIEAAIRADHPVVFGTNVGKELLSYDGGNFVFNLPKKSIGGHAMCIVGVRTNSSGNKEFCIRNSWGSGWGINGHCWFSSDYIMAEETCDIFVATRMPNLLV